MTGLGKKVDDWFRVVERDTVEVEVGGSVGESSDDDNVDESGIDIEEEGSVGF